MKEREKQPAIPTNLNYHYYGKNKYDRDIVSAIPFHREIHESILKELQRRFQPDQVIRVLELGVGTGLTTSLIRAAFPNAEFELVDFSSTMLSHAKKRLGTKKIVYRLGDFSKIRFHSPCDVVVAVIGIHHLSHSGKRNLFQKIALLLKPGGIFLFGDLMTCADEKDAAERSARHYHHLVEHAGSRSMLRDWTHHHMFLNNLATIEDQEKWLQDTGCRVKRLFYQWNTALLLATKQ
ncbi:MAG TPA: class I SAM-dependent methyltransferase [Candidatus Paceibacterota bacterium]